MSLNKSTYDHKVIREKRSGKIKSYTSKQIPSQFDSVINPVKKQKVNNSQKSLTFF